MACSRQSVCSHRMLQAIDKHQHEYIGLGMAGAESEARVPRHFRCNYEIRNSQALG